MNQREIEFKTISKILTLWEVEISNLNSINLYDANLFSEHSICELLNCIFDYQLQNTNALKMNYPAIDLGDKHNRIAFQITTTKSHRKIQSTIDKFFEHKLYDDYDELFILIIGRKQVKYKKFNLPSGYSFDNEKHIIDFKDLLRHVYFLPTLKIKKISKLLLADNIIPQHKVQKSSNATRIKRNLSLKKRMKKDFLMELDRKEWEHSWYEPWIKFKYHNVIIRSVDDTTFPNVEDVPSGVMSSWFKGEFWDFYENGLELISGGDKAIIDKNNNWDILDWRGDEREKNLKYKTIIVHTFLRIPFDYIVEYDMETDAYYSLPSIYVEYKKEGMPYEEILYGQMGLYDIKAHTRYLDNNKRMKLSLVHDKIYKQLNVNNLCK